MPRGSWPASRDDKLRGTYVDPDSGREAFRKYAEEWLENRTLDPSTRIRMHQRLGKHVYPVIGSKQLGYLSTMPSTIQAMVRA